MLARRLLVSNWCRVVVRANSDVPKAQLIENKLKEEFDPTDLKVVDHSGGCPGGTLEVEIHSEKFNGKNELQRHRMVNKILKEEIATFHAFVLRPFPVAKE